MEIVVDTSSIIAVVTNESAKAALVEKTQDAILFAPRSVHWEIGNAFSAMLKRGRISLAQATVAVEAYKQIELTLVDVDLVKALGLSSRLGIYAYDAYLIVCAQDRECPLLSLDGGLIYAAKSVGVTIIEVKS